MNIARFLMFFLAIAHVELCQAGMDSKQEFSITHIRPVLAREIVKHKRELEKMWPPLGSRSKALLAMSTEILKDITLFPPILEILPKKFAIIPFFAPSLALLTAGPHKYSRYMEEHVKLIQFRYKVECLQKLLGQRNKSKKNDRMITWFLKEGYNEACDAIKKDFFASLEDQLIKEKIEGKDKGS